MVKRIISTILIICGFLMIGGAFALAGFNLWDDSRAGNEASEVLENLEKVQEAQENDNIDSPLYTPDYILNPKMDMPAVEIDGVRYIGTVSIPLFNLELPVAETWSYPQMQKTPCRYSGSAYLNDLVLCAHNYNSHFGGLRNLQQGDAVIFTDMDGNEFPYEVELVEDLQPTAIEEMKSSDWDLSLFTCTLDGQTRVTVRCNKIN